ncbi:MAG: saccharopine dehydrogenase C-terminal domain-containing protein, partial [Chitinophagaceae bacterium]
MKAILVVGAGRSATSLIDFLTRETAALGWSLCVADGNPALAASKTGSARHVKAIGLNVEDEQDCLTEVQKADLVISLLPPHLHVHLAKACLKAKKHFLTASYVDPGIRAYEKEIASQKLLFLYEMGLDPGIDHMSALKMIEEIRAEGGQIISFRSHCGGLVAPESDNNPWHYKISWNTRNIVQAGKAGARFRQNGQITDIGYEDLFDPNRIVAIPELGNYAWYPN